MVLGVPVFKHFMVDKSNKMDLDLWYCLRRGKKSYSRINLLYTGRLCHCYMLD